MYDEVGSSRLDLPFLFSREKFLTPESAEAIVGKFMLVTSSRGASLAAPEQAVADFDLAEEEITNLKCLDIENPDHILAVCIVKSNPGARWSTR